MKYTVINELSNFNFHDAKIYDIYFQSNQMIWELSVLQTPIMYIQGNRDEKIYIKDAVMIFENAHIESFVSGGYKTYNSTGNLIDSKDSIEVLPIEYSDIFKAVSCGFYEIFGIKKLCNIDNNRYMASFAISNYDITITFTQSIIKWNEFGGKSWYENKTWMPKRYYN